MGEKNDKWMRRVLAGMAKQVPYDEQKARKKAGKLRKSFVRDKGHGDRGRVTEDNWEELLDQHGRARRQRLSDVIAEASPSDAVEGHDEVSDAEFAKAAIVMSVTGSRCRIFHEGEELDCVVPPHIAMMRGSALAAGDRVEVVFADEVWRIETVLPRRTVLARPDPINKHLQRLIAANIDVVINVVSVKSPPLRPRLIDRFLIAIQRGGALPVICVNKIDLLSGEELEEELAKLAVYRDLDVPVIPCSTRTGRGIDELRQLCDRNVSALVGHSGVGKSSILNALDHSLGLATNTLHRRGTGRHTTTRATLYDFGEDTYIIDTPGIREFGLWDLDRESLRDYFPEFEEPAESCRFTDCSHVHEPDCEVRDRVEQGSLNRARYETYLRLYESM